MNYIWIVFSVILFFVCLFLLHTNKVSKYENNSRIFNPVKCEYDFIRLGKDNDGGYVLLDNTFGASVVFGYGILDDCSFENDITRHFNIKGYIFDHTISSPPSDMNDRITFVKEGISDKDEENLKTLSYHKDKYAKHENIILKIDVEGAEWNSLRDIDMSYVTQLLIEFHDMEMDSVNWDLIKKLNDDFYLVNLHGNNNSKIVDVKGKRLPSVIETSWVRKDLIKSPIFYDDYNLLNHKCNPGLDEMEHLIL